MGRRARSAVHSSEVARDLGFASWLLGGFVLIVVMPVILAAVLGAVAGPAVSWPEHHRVPRIGGAILVLLAPVAGAHAARVTAPDGRRSSLSCRGSARAQSRPI